MLTVNQVIASSGNMNSSFSSSAMPLNQKWGYSIQASYASGSSGGAPSGSLYLQGSNDYSNPTTWTGITGTTAVITGAGSTMWNSQFANYKWVQMVYTAGVGGSSGMLTAVANTNGIA